MFKCSGRKIHRERVALQVSSLGEQERVEEMEVLTRLRGESH